MKKVTILLLGVLAAAATTVAAEDKDPKKVSPPASKPASAPAVPTVKPTISLVPPGGSGAMPVLVPGQAAPAAPVVPAGPGGTVEVKERSFDAGTVERGGAITHAFVLKNVGKHDLTVDAKPG